MSQIRQHFARQPWLRCIWFKLHYWQQHNRCRKQGENNAIVFGYEQGFSRLQRTDITIEGHDNQIEIADRTQLSQLRILVTGSQNQIIIGPDCRIAGGTLWIHADNAQLIIQAQTTIAEATIGIAENGGKITIGKDCMLSHGIDIRCGDSHAIVDLESGQQLNQASHIAIGHHVWLGMHSRILKDVTIADDSVIAAGSIVTKSIPSNSIAAGIPAKVKRQNITWQR